MFKRFSDPVLQDHVRLPDPVNREQTEIIDAGYDEETVRRVVKMVDVSEYKRRQAAAGLRITPNAFGVDRRVPIARRIEYF